nr:lipoprotein insertase outer membrane protein LolB [Acidovorax sp. 1608163]
MFELEGEESQGQLTLFSPLGTTLGQLRWDAGTATLQTGQQIQRSDSLDALVLQLTGAALPVKAIFHWLKGSQAEAAGWTSDLSAAHQGRITAQRVLPEPKATLRISLSH